MIEDWKLKYGLPFVTVPVEPIEPTEPVKIDWKTKYGITPISGVE